MGGAGPLTSYAQLREYSNELKIRRVIWLYNETTDLNGPGFRDYHKHTGLKLEMQNPILKKYLTEEKFNQNLISKQNLINELNQKKLDALINGYFSNQQTKKKTLRNFIKLRKFRGYLIKQKNHFYYKNFRKDKITDDFKHIILKTQKLLKEKNAKFYFVYITDIDRYTNKKFKYDKNDYTKVIEFINSKEDIHLINLHEEFFKNLNHDPLDYFAKQFNNDYQHYNIEGNKIISNIILKKIEKIEKE